MEGWRSPPASALERDVRLNLSSGVNKSVNGSRTRSSSSTADPSEGYVLNTTGLWEGGTSLLANTWFSQSEAADPAGDLKSKESWTRSYGAKVAW